MNEPGRHAKCPENPCVGPRCKASTGKTARKQNWARSKPNKHTGDPSRMTGGGGKKKGK